MTTTFEAYAKFINARDYGAVGNSVADDTSAIQSAIDAAYAQNISCVYLPAGNYKTTSTLYLDPPLNLRSSRPTPTIFSFCMALIGDNGTGNHEGDGTRLRPNFQNDVALYVGPGQGMRVEGITIQASVSAYRGLQDTGGIGIAIAGGSGGTSRCVIENCWVENFYYGYYVGPNNTNLGDSTTFRKCVATNVYIGINFGATQNYVNTIYDCNMNGTIGVRANVGQPVWGWGGNMSCQSTKANTFSISSISALTASTYGGSCKTYSFTAVVASPDSFMNTYDVAVIPTVGFGLIPCSVDSWNSGTSTISLTVIGQFAGYEWGGGAGFDAAGNSDLTAEIQAATEVSVCETATTFWGTGINWDGLHMENASTGYFRFWNGSTGFDSAQTASFKNVFFNADLTKGEYAGSVTAAGKATFRCAQVHPFIQSANAHQVIFENFACQDYELEKVFIDTTSTNRLRAYFKNVGQHIFQFRDFKSVHEFDNSADGARSNSYQYPNTLTYGIGEWDEAPNNNFDAATGSEARQTGWPATRYYGNRPHPADTPKITPAQFDTFTSGSLGTITTYPPLFGETTYQVGDVDPSIPMFVRSRHDGFSYGQDITVNWSYKGQTSTLYIENMAVAGSIHALYFPGLTIGLDNGGGVIYYVIVSRHANLGYVKVQRINSGGNGGRLLAGVKTTTYTGATITQQPYAFEILSAPNIVTLTSDYTLTDSSTAQKAFNSSTNGALTVKAKKTYLLEALYLITNVGTTSHTWSTLFAGTATLTSIGYMADVSDSVGGNVLTAPKKIYATAATALAVTAASTDADQRVIISLKGIIRVDAAGTIIPQIKLSAATTGASKMLANSFCKLTPITSNLTANVGDWS